MEKYAIGVDLGGTSIKLGIVSPTGKIVKKISVDTKAEGGPKSVISQIGLGIRELTKDQKLKYQGIGIGSPGVVSVEKGTVVNPPNLPHWKTVKLGELIQKEFKLKTRIENDANAAAIGELVFGAGKNFESFVMITLGTGVGGGIIIDKKIYRGNFGVAGELGHITIDYKGRKCNCGNYGCIETYAGNGYLVRQVKEDIYNHPDSKIIELIGNELDQLTPKIISEALTLGDKYAEEIVNELGTRLGAALASVTNLFDIANFVIGGGVAGFGKPLYDAIKLSTQERVLASVRNRIKIIPAKLKNEAGILGASALVFYKA